MTSPLTVAVAGLGAIGARVVRALDVGIPGLTLTAVSARRHDRASTFLSELHGTPRLLPLEDLAAEADIVVECLPPHLLGEVAA
ncbi:MAG: aspartate dehydrogenase, partial [Boseongicola sp.]